MQTSYFPLLPPLLFLNQLFSSLIFILFPIRTPITPMQPPRQVSQKPHESVLVVLPPVTDCRRRPSQRRSVRQRLERRVAVHV